MLPFWATQPSSTEELRQGKVGQYCPQTGVGHCVQIMPMWGTEERLLKARWGGMRAIGVQNYVTPSAVLTGNSAKTVLRSTRPLHRHICRKLRHEHSGSEGTSSSCVLTFKVIQEGFWKAHLVWSRSGVDSRYCRTEMTPNTTWLFVFQSHCDSALYPKLSSCCLHSTCSVSCNRQLPLHSLCRGVFVQRRSTALSVDAAVLSLFL